VFHVLVLGLVVLSPIADLSEGVLISSMEEKELAVRDHLVDELVEQARPGINSLRVANVTQAIKHVMTKGMEAKIECEEDIFLALEVVVKGSLRKADLVGDLSQRRLVVTMLGEQIESNVQYSLACRSPRPPTSRSLISTHTSSGLEVAGYTPPVLHDV